MARPPAFHSAYIGIGSNQTDPVRQADPVRQRNPMRQRNPVRHVREAFAELALLPSTRVTARSSLYRSAPLGKLDQPDFINAVACVETALSPAALLRALLAIEQRHGRTRGEPNAPRTLDLDLLLYADQVVDTPELKLPHPRMHQRAFVLVPLAEVSPALAVPGRGPLNALLQAVAGQRVERLSAPA